MKIYSVYDPEFKPYGQIVIGLDAAVKEILEAQGGAKVGLKGENIDIADSI